MMIKAATTIVWVLCKKHKSPGLFCHGNHHKPII